MTTHIEIKGEDISRPKERPPKTNWKIELIKKGLGVLQHAAPKASAEIIWHYFTMPGRVFFTEKQREIIKQGDAFQTSYKGDVIKHYRWGSGKRKVLICHGWRSKSADFRRMIQKLVAEGYEVQAVDMRAHGQSEGKHTALPEFRDIIKNHIAKNGPFDVVIGHSLGALAAGVALSELGATFHPKNFFLIAAPPFVRYFFKDIVTDVGCNEAVYLAMCAIVKDRYHQPVDYFDLRLKAGQIQTIDTHLIYCENDQVIPFEKGTELEEAWPHASFVHVKGLGHYRIIANDSIIDYILKFVETG